ncbi:dephospho-CoA kinase [Methylocystis sp. H4A]|uniref:dephospho-CoA kinase n=1 Tax=Methylocystis sp. H4A TaxID=2785788 RepID=UPI0018C21076|nr:dephospho-CoA kinase [Methylocystis sp. H4A]MBG0801450.1 dephospho-CoA kinase [Methylocystis sp. H4A]MBG0802052.1 dephospho-CoA kinase [Methylocystis sp. H4A]
MLRVGLTGSIGMGKSTTADMFRAEGVAVLDSDQLVHDLYKGPAAAEIERAFPGVVVNGVVDRRRLAARVLDDPAALKRLEAIVHPMVWAARDALIEERRHQGDHIVVFDIPLLFETGAEKDFDVIVVVTAPEDVQKARVLAREGMTVEKFASILSKQTPDSEKRARADFVVHTDRGLDAARQEVRNIVKALEARLG